jgi:hypothetical protein
MATVLSSAPRPRLLLRLLLLLIAVLTWSDFGVRVLLPAVRAPHWPNPAYWVAARLTVEGNADLIYADRDVFFQQAARLGTVPDIFEANMPTTILVFLPLAAFSETTARTIWDLLMVVCYILACAILFRALAPTRTIEIGLWALAPLFHPWRENISRGQAYALLFLLLVVGAVRGLRRHGAETQTESRPVGRTQIVAGLAVGLFAIIKLYYAAILLLPALFWRRWRLLITAITLFVFAAIVSIALWGSEQWVRALGFAVTWRDRPESAVTAYQTLNSWLTHLLRYDATYNPGPVVNMPGLVGWLWWAGAVVMLALTGWALFVHRRVAGTGSETFAQGLLPTALVVPVSLVLAPVAEDYHFVLVLFPLLVLGRTIWDTYTQETVGGGSRARLCIVLGAITPFVALLLLGAPWRFNVAGVEGWRSLLYYPRLYGALLLWALVMVLLIAERRSAAVPTPDISRP